jgi:EAL domain-containing protein (putative c-di-GMP-specific phosphodiesterase class I)
MFGFGQDETLDYTTFRSLVLAEELARFDHTVAETIDGQQRFRAVQHIDGIVRLARGLGVQVIAEKVDRTELLFALRDAGVRGAGLSAR